MTPTIINKFGRIVGWSDITLIIFGRPMEAITEISYTDEVKKENEYGAGGYPMGQSRGNYEAKASISIYSEELLAIQNSIPAGMRIQDIAPFPIVVMYDLNGVIRKDIINNASFMNNGKEVKQGDGKIVTKLDLLISHVDWNV